MITTNFSKYKVVEYWLGTEIKPPAQHLFDYADDNLGIVGFRSIEKVILTLWNKFEKNEYQSEVPTSYHVKNLKIRIEPR